MFRNFTRSGETTPAKVVALHEVPPPAVAAGPGAAQFVTQAEKDLVKRLELKSKLHDVVLERMNLNVIDKIDPEDLKREMTALVSQVLAAENTPLPAAELAPLPPAELAPLPAAVLPLLRVGMVSAA